MRVALVVVALLVGLVAPSVVGAQEGAAPEIEVAVTFDPPAATIGDRLTLTVQARHVVDVVVTIARPTLPDAELVADTPPSITSEPDGRVVTTKRFTYQVFALGEVDTGAIEVRWLIEDGTSGVIEAPGAAFRVIPTRAEGDLALRPLKPQATIAGAPPSWVRPAAIGAAAVALVAVLVAPVIWWWRRPRGEQEEEVSPHEAEATARARLDALRHLRLTTEEAYQGFYAEIASAVREYLGERFGFNAFALTTSELERRMTSHGIDRWQARLVGGLLDRCDDAVYARQYPDPASADHDLTVAYEIVELSRPRPRALEEATELAS